MNKIIVGLAERSYPIWIGQEIYAALGAALDEVNFPNKVAVVTNPTVGDLYCNQVVDVLVQSGRQVDVIRLPDGEEYKR